MAHDYATEQAALHNIETCAEQIRLISEQMAALQAERDWWDERLEHWNDVAAEQKLLFEEEETRRQERAVR